MVVAWFVDARWWLIVWDSEQLITASGQQTGIIDDLVTSLRSIQLEWVTRMHYQWAEMNENKSSSGCAMERKRLTGPSKSVSLTHRWIRHIHNGVKMTNFNRKYRSETSPWHIQVLITSESHVRACSLTFDLTHNFLEWHRLHCKNNLIIHGIRRLRYLCDLLRSFVVACPAVDRFSVDRLAWLQGDTVLITRGLNCFIIWRISTMFRVQKKPRKKKEKTNQSLSSPTTQWDAKLMFIHPRPIELVVICKLSLNWISIECRRFWGAIITIRCNDRPWRWAVLCNSDD